MATQFVSQVIVSAFQGNADCHWPITADIAETRFASSIGLHFFVDFPPAWFVPTAHNVNVLERKDMSASGIDGCMSRHKWGSAWTTR